MPTLYQIVLSCLLSILTMWLLEGCPIYRWMWPNWLDKLYYGELIVALRKYDKYLIEYDEPFWEYEFPGQKRFRFLKTKELIPRKIDGCVDVYLDYQYDIYGYREQGWWTWRRVLNKLEEYSKVKRKRVRRFI